MIRFIVRLITSTAFCLSLFFLRTVIAETVLTEVPAGFESLNQPMTSIIDVYFQGQLLATASATFTSDTILFATPDTILIQILNLKDKHTVLAHLSGWISSHSRYLCYAPTQKDCGLITPDVIGVIFDDQSFRADLFINPNFLESVEKASVYLPASTSEIGLLQGVVFNYSESSQADGQTYNLSANTLIGWQQEHLESSWSIAQQQNLKIQSLLWAYDNMGMRYSAGYLRSGFASSGFLLSHDLAGISFGSSDNTLLSKDHSSSTPLEVIMPDRGIVEVFRDQRLIHSELLDAGYQAINTSGFPNGTYEVEIKIRTTGGATLRSEKRMFVKQSRIKTGDDKAWFLEAGQTLHYSNSLLPETSRQITIRAGYEHGLTQNTGVRWSLASSRSEQVAEVAVAYFLPGLSLNSGVLTGLQQQLGTYLSIDWNGSRTVWLNAESRRLWHQVDQTETIHTHKQKLISYQKVFDTVTLGLPVRNGYITARYSYRENPSSSEHLKTLTFHSNLLKSRSNSLRMDCSLTESENRLSFQLSLNLVLDFYNLNHQARAQYAEVQTNKQISRELRSTYESEWQDSNQDRHTDQTARFGIDITENSRNVFGTYDNTSRLGNLSMAFNHSQQENSSDVFGYSGSFSTSLSVSKKGIALGGADRTNSAITVYIENSSSSDVFRVLVNEQFAGFAEGNSATTIPLSPFNTYRVRLENTDGSLYEFSGKQSTVTLYPGNIEHFSFQVWKSITLFGQIVDSKNNFNANYCAYSKEFISCSNEFGLFQAELSDKETSITLKRATQSCSVPIDSGKAVEGFLDLGTIICP